MHQLEEVILTKEEMEALGILAFINKPFNDEKAKLICEVMRNFQNEQ